MTTVAMTSKSNEDTALRHREYSSIVSPDATFDVEWIGPTPTIRKRREYMTTYFIHLVGPDNFNSRVQSSIREASEKAASKELAAWGVSQCVTSYFEWCVDFYVWHHFFNSIKGTQAKPAAWPWPIAPPADSDELSATYEKSCARILEEKKDENITETICDAGTIAAKMGESDCQESEPRRENLTQRLKGLFGEMPLTSSSRHLESSTSDVNDTKDEVELLRARLSKMEQELLTTEARHSEAIGKLETQLAESFASAQRLKEDAEMRATSHLEQIGDLKQQNADLRNQLSRSIRCHEEVQRLYENLSNACSCEAGSSNTTEQATMRNSAVCGHEEELKSLHESLDESKRIRREVEAKLDAALSQQALANAIHHQIQDSLQAATEIKDAQNKIRRLQQELDKGREQVCVAKENAQHALNQAREHERREAEAHALLHHKEQNLESALKVVSKLSIENDELGDRVGSMKAALGQRRIQEEMLLKDLEQERAVAASLRTSLEDFTAKDSGQKRRRLNASIDLIDLSDASPKHSSNVAPSTAQFHFAVSSMSDLSEITKVSDYFGDHPAHERMFQQFLDRGSLDTWFAFREVRRKGSRARKPCSLGSADCPAHEDSFHVMVTMEGSRRRLRFQ